MKNKLKKQKRYGTNRRQKANGKIKLNYIYNYFIIIILLLDNVHLTPIRMATVKKTVTSVGDTVKKTGTLVHCWWEWKIVQQLWKIGRKFLKKSELPYDPAIPLVGSYAKELKAGT